MRILARCLRRHPAPRGRAGGWAPVAALAGLALLAAACSSTPSGAGVANVGSTSTTAPSTASGSGSGSGSTAGSGGSGKDHGALAFSLCMRKHGIADFPEPNAQGQIQVNAGPGSDLNPSSSAFQAAMKACRSLGPGGNLTPAERQQQLANALKFSQCMHKHGIADFPEPNAQGDFSIAAGPGSDLNPRSPQFQAAQKACQSLLQGKGKAGFRIGITSRAPAPGPGSGPSTR